jgi:hypothetical protein
LGLSLGSSRCHKPPVLTQNSVLTKENQDLVQTLVCNQIGTQTDENYYKNSSQNHFKFLSFILNQDKK